ncbi:MAG TPA: SAM-dependent methyltransferase [Mycobacteriales bacterium]|nr:SAM-dependent methyltransferase [Mycobacteriales bacterium]
MSLSPMWLNPIGVVQGGRVTPEDDHWAGTKTVIEIDPVAFGTDAVAGLDAFSHLEIVYAFHLARAEDVTTGARHPRGRSDWPLVGIFAQRGKDRPNHLGVSRCRLLRVDGLHLHVADLDAIDGTPVLDVKPWMAEFGPRGDVRQPEWAGELMQTYY